MDYPPNQTLYIKNLNEKVQLAILKRALYSRFSEFGPILDIVANKTFRGRGQAFVVYSDISSAKKAKENLDSTQFLDKPMRIYFAKSKSDAVASVEGQYDPSVREARAQRRKLLYETLHAPQAESRKRTSAAMPEEVVPKAKQVSKKGYETPLAGPNKVLFVKGLPKTISQDVLNELFSQHEGFQSATLIPGRPGFAFIEFGDESQSSICLSAMNGTSVEDSTIDVSFAKA
ncbi:hypothetical protein P9112_003028 [Eukaryota sp. TZLM1-RC]